METQAPSPGTEPALQALDELMATAEEAHDLLTVAVRQAEHVRQLRTEGMPWSELVPAEPRPLVVELLTTIQERLSAAGSQWRRTQARALYDEGMTTQAIADLFGVTRQRISALLSTTTTPAVNNPDESRS